MRRSCKDKWAKRLELIRRWTGAFYWKLNGGNLNGELLLLMHTYGNKNKKEAIRTLENLHSGDQHTPLKAS